MPEPENKEARRGESESRADDDSERDRRGTNRVRDDQASGRGSASALSKWKMIERRRSVVPRRQQD